MATLNPEQIISIIIKSLYCQFLENAQGKLTATYPCLSPEQKLKLFNSGLEALSINTLTKKKELLTIRNSLITEEKSFDLSVKEKENILRLLITSLDLSPEQRQSLENMGVSFFDASH